MENKKTFKEWFEGNKSELIQITNKNLKQGTDWKGNPTVLRGASKVSCYREINKILRLNIVEELRTMDLQYDGIPLSFHGEYDKTYSDTTSTRQVDIVISVDKMLSEEEEELESINMILTNFTMYFDVKLEKVQSSTNSWLIKDVNVSSDDYNKSIDELILFKLDYITKSYNEAFSELEKQANIYKNKLLSEIESIDNGDYEKYTWFDDSKRSVRRASEFAQKSIKFFETINKIKSKLNK